MQEALSVKVFFPLYHVWNSELKVGHSGSFVLDEGGGG